jgi:hypothetical protein
VRRVPYWRSPAVGLLALELNLSFDGNRPGFAKTAAQHIGPPVLTIGCCAGLLRQSFLTRSSGSQQTLRLEVEMDVAFSCAL